MLRLDFGACPRSDTHMPIKDIKAPPKDKPPRKDRSTLWVDPTTADVFRKLVKFTGLDPSILLDKMIGEYIQRHHADELEVEVDEDQTPVTPPLPFEPPVKPAKPTKPTKRRR